MAELAIPAQFRSGLEKLKSLDEKSLRILSDVLLSEKPALFRDELAEHVASKLANLSPDEVKEIVNTLLGFCWGKESLGYTTVDFVEQLVAQTFAEGDPKRDLFQHYLPRLLQTESLIVTSKAFDILTEHQRTIHDLRIITDLRPIFKEGFDEEPGSMPAAAVITHTLKISYHAGREVEEFFVALDDQDIDLLRSLMDRAESKERSLRGILEATKIPFIRGGMD